MKGEVCATLTLRIQILKGSLFWPPKNPKYSFLNWDIMQLFSANAKIFVKNRFFLPMKTWKKRPQNSLIIGPESLFQYRPGCSNDPKTEISCPLMQKWVFTYVGTGRVSMSEKRPSPNISALLTNCVNRNIFDLLSSGTWIAKYVHTKLTSVLSFYSSYIF